MKPTDFASRLRSLAILQQTLEPEVSLAKEQPSAVKRVVSVDIFRGLNILLMIFPGFLFLMGMAIPLAVDARLARGQSKMEIWAHVVWRAVSLLVLGLLSRTPVTWMQDSRT